jgi:putative ABC transport system permease protein
VPQIDYCFYQLPDEILPVFRSQVTMAVRTPLDIAAVMPVIKNAVYGANQDQPVYNIHSIPEIVSASMASQRFPMILLSAFAVLALLLACVGIYGVISYSMSRRTQELGIRMALGAERWDILRMVLGQSLGLTVAGITIGAVAAFTLTRMLSSFSELLYGVRSNDPLTFIAASFVLLGASLLACYIPARRAARLDPTVALRHE